MVVGLGNPGERYAGTRHNVGFMVVDALAQRLGVSFKKKLFHSYSVGKGPHEGQSLYLVKPLTFMNNSGRAVREALRETGCSVSEMLVVCDTLDLSPGSLRLQAEGLLGRAERPPVDHPGSRHRGVHAPVDRDRQARLQGTGHRPRPGRAARGEEELIAEAVEKAARAVLLLLTEGPARVMNEVNRREPPS